MGARLEFVDFGGLDPLGVAAVARYEDRLLELKAQGVRVAAVLIANPHNPLGRCYPRDALLEFMRLCRRHGAHLVSDEVYALSVFPNTVDKDDDGTPSCSPPFCSVLWTRPRRPGPRSLHLGRLQGLWRQRAAPRRPHLPA
jgi:hypothetical protein